MTAASKQVTYISGDTWNVNPIALRRVEKLFCKNERAILRTTLADGGQTVTLVAVAAILVAGIRLNFLDGPLGLRNRGPDVLPCGACFAKGQEMGWFEHGSTIIVFAPDELLAMRKRAGGRPRPCRPAADAGAVMARSASPELSFRFRHVRTFVRRSRLLCLLDAVAGPLHNRHHLVATQIGDERA